MNESEDIQQLAERFRASGLLGKPGTLSRLFDYLLERSIAGAPPKEIEIAIDVFGKDESFAVAQDSTVRVYVHKLRRKLEEFHTLGGRDDAAHLVLPKGEYRIGIEGNDAPAAEITTQSPPPHVEQRSRLNLRNALAAAAGCFLLLCAGLLGFNLHSGDPASELDTVRHNPVWARVLDDDRPVVIVVGDYYIFGETDPRSGAVKRMVREFSINSARELEEQLQSDPQLSSRYEDLDLAYLPTSTAFAMRDVLTTLAAPGQPQQRVQIVLASSLTTDMLRTSHVIYIGYISGMRQLQELAFQHSRLSVGSSFDELVDKRTGERYVSQAGQLPEAGTMYRDYGFFSSFPGPTGNRFVVIAGTRDVAVMETAQALTRAWPLAELARSTQSDSFEALYEVAGLNRSNLSGRLLFSAALGGTQNSPSNDPAAGDNNFFLADLNDSHGR
ncbi:helix-turn-helix domain-containing protein [Peristeroidobacter agariperforans]|uniref:helix-turn-helix domain-containing protein n=1 Tax=Peristeroidobacter agariperforans TaxID=268404 RepID=UPI00101BA366|nr:helix-turn-helix domain-containing protein [Peristeroidobacter agariperforans]